MKDTTVKMGFNWFLQTNYHSIVRYIIQSMNILSFHLSSFAFHLCFSTLMARLKCLGDTRFCARNHNTQKAKGSWWTYRQMGLLGLCVMMWGCSGLTSSSPASPSHQAAMTQLPPSYQEQGPSDGSLWDNHSHFGEMFINAKARRIGDLVTIKISENASATNKAGTTTDRSSSLSAGISNFFNAELDHPSDSPFFNPFGSVKGSIGSEFEGTGETKRSGALTAYMTARVVDILPSGNLIIEGNREVRVNSENQLITLTGTIRPQDISSNNVIQSTYIADARIGYSGKGVLNDRQKPGWLTRIFDKIWPF